MPSNFSRKIGYIQLFKEEQHRGLVCSLGPRRQLCLSNDSINDGMNKGHFTVRAAEATANLKHPAEAVQL